MAAAKLLDDPDHINAFLSMIGAFPITPRVAMTAENEEDKKPPGNEQATTDNNENENTMPDTKDENKTPDGDDTSNQKAIAETRTPEVRSRAQSTTSSPAVGTKAPPPTPVSTAVIAAATDKLESIKEDETDILAKLADESKLSLSDSKFAHKLHYPVAEYIPGVSTSFNQRTLGCAGMPPSFTPKIRKEMVIDDPPKGYIEHVISQFQKKHINDFKKDDAALTEQIDQKTSEMASIVVAKPLVPSNDKYDKPIKPNEKVSQDVKTADSKSSKDAAASDMSPAKVQGAAVGITGSEIMEEDREYLTHFKSWGKPEARDKPAASVRRITLSRLPVDADLTLVQSLVHGGAIDDMLLMGASRVAYVRFTSGDACEKYCANYPNGLIFKYRGRSYTVFVDKCKDVDVISGMLQGYIDCGASRCVRAIGADEEWGMGALMKLAEGKNRKGKVENITDVYRNRIRSIVFRFTSIGEAVAFKGVLMRDEDWEACNIQFAADPCEKATDVHLE